jgi:hypothetical protein
MWPGVKLSRNRQENELCFIHFQAFENTLYLNVNNTLIILLVEAGSVLDYPCCSLEVEGEREKT